MTKRASIDPRNLARTEGFLKGQVDAHIVSVGEGQTLTVTSVNEEKSRNGTIIVPPQWSDHGRRLFQSNRTAALAEVTDRQVIMVDFNGVGPNNSPFTSDQEVKSLSEGFTVHGELAWNAIRESGLSMDGDVTLLGTSQGASIVGGMLETAPEEVVSMIGDVILWESATMHDEPKSPAAFAINFMRHGGDGIKYYHQRNPSWMVQDEGIGRLVRQIPRQARAHWLPVQMMAEGGLADRLKDVFKQQDQLEARVHIINGSASKISLTRDNERAARKLLAEGIDVRNETFLGEYHAAIDYVSFYAGVVQRLVNAVA